MTTVEEGLCPAVDCPNVNDDNVKDQSILFTKQICHQYVADYYTLIRQQNNKNVT